MPFVLPRETPQHEAPGDQHGEEGPFEVEVVGFAKQHARRDEAQCGGDHVSTRAARPTGPPDQRCGSPAVLKTTAKTLSSMNAP